MRIWGPILAVSDFRRCLGRFAAGSGMDVELLADEIVRLLYGLLVEICILLGLL